MQIKKVDENEKIIEITLESRYPSYLAQPKSLVVEGDLEWPRIKAAAKQLTKDELLTSVNFDKFKFTQAEQVQYLGGLIVRKFKWIK